MGTRRSSFVRLYHHYIWGTKNREALIDKNVEILIRDSFASKSAELGLKILENNGTENHVHLLVSSPATLTPADIARHLKGASSYHVNNVTDSLCFRWQDGYGVVSVSPGNLAAVRKYIRYQKEHHRKDTLNELLERDCGES